MDKLNKPYIIAEAGVNHNGSIEIAKKLVQVAKDSGADAIKFQTFLEGECTGKFAVMVDYMEEAYQEEKERYEVTQELVLPFEGFVQIKQFADEIGITFISTPDGTESLNFIADELKVPMIKVASTEVTNLKFLEEIARKEVPVILSTGLSNMEEVKKAVEAIRKHNDQIYVLHCLSEYPAPIDEVNLNAIVTMRNELGIPIGFSDHTKGDEASIAAVALGAEIIEKHFTLDRKMDGPDHKASIEPHELKEFIRKLRNTSMALGDGIKKAQPSELKNLEGIRRSVVAKRELKAGTTLSKEDITCKRPATGIHPYEIDNIIGKSLNRNLQMDEPIKWEDLN